MTPEKLDEMERLVAAMTPLPWKVILPGDVTWDERRKYRCVDFGTGDGYTTSPINPPDASGIVALRNAASDLIAAGRREAALRDVLNSAEVDDDFDGAFIDYLVPFKVIDRLRALLSEEVPT